MTGDSELDTLILMFGPTGCLVDTPKAYTIEFGGEHISLTELANITGLDNGYLSRVLSGKSEPSVKRANLIALALGMTVEDFITAVEARKVA